MKHKGIILMTLILALALTTAACNTTEKTVEPVEVHFQLPLFAINDDSWSTSYRQLYLDAAENFHKINPQITVKVDQIPGKALQENINELKSEASPDIFPLFDMNGLPAFEKEGVLIDLLPLQRLAGSKDLDINKSILDMATVNEKLLALPYSIDPFAVVYNKDFFDAAQIPYPQNDWTWEQFRDISQKLSPTGGSMLPYMPEFIDLLMASYEKSIMSPTGETFVGYLDSPEAVKTFQWLNAYFHDDPEKKDWLGSIGTDFGFETFKTGMALGNFFAYSDYKNKFGDKKDRLGVASLPHFEGVKRVNQVLFVQGFGISQKSKHPEDAWKFIEYLTLSNNEDSAKFADYYLTPSESVAEAFHQKLDPVKSIFNNELKYVVKNSLISNPNAAGIWSEEIRTRFNNLLTTADNDIPGKLHELAVKLDQEMNRVNNSL